MYRNAHHRENARSMRSNPTDAERVLWQALRCEQLQGHKFRRQAAIGDYLVDFVCFEARLIIEVDGGQHNEPSARAYDDRRTGWLESEGFRVLRYWNHEVLEDVDSVVGAIWLAIGERVPDPPPSPLTATKMASPPGGGG